MTKGQDRLARDAWQGLRSVVQRHFEVTTAASHTSGISPVMGYFLHALITLPAGPMKQLVQHLGVDAAWVTTVVDRLEARGDVVRVPSAVDRRAKILQVTPAGRRTWRRLERMVTTPPPGLAQLPREDLETLVRIGQHLAAVAEAPRKTPARTPRVRRATDSDAAPMDPERMR